MTVRETILAIAIAFSLPAIANAGGPVIAIEDTTETVAPDRQRNVLPFLIAGALIVALIAGQSGNCVTEEVTPGPTPPSGC